VPHRPEVALGMLREGNQRFVEGRALDHFSAAERASAVAGQRPWAAVIGCSDSRVPVEAVFDVGVGELFVVRTAGHVLSDAGLASVRFAVEALGVRLVVVLGHENCGAVSAALAGGTPAWLSPVVDRIDVSAIGPVSAPAGADDARLTAAVDMHARATAALVREWFARADVPEQPRVAGAAYKLASGEVHWLD